MNDLKDPNKKSLCTQIQNKFIRKHGKQYKVYLNNEVIKFLNYTDDVINSLRDFEINIEKEIKSGQYKNKLREIKKEESEKLAQIQRLEEIKKKEEMELVRQEMERKKLKEMKKQQEQVVIDLQQNQNNYLQDIENQAMPSERLSDSKENENLPIKPLRIPDNFHLIMNADFFSYRQQQELQKVKKKIEQKSLRDSYDQQVNEKKNKLQLSSIQDNKIMDSLLEKGRLQEQKEKQDIEKQFEKVKKFKFDLENEIKQKQDYKELKKYAEMRYDKSTVRKDSEDMMFHDKLKVIQKKQFVDQAKQQKQEIFDKKMGVQRQIQIEKQQDLDQCLDYLDKFEQQQKTKMIRYDNMNKYLQYKNDQVFQNHKNYLSKENKQTDKYSNKSAGGIFDAMGKHHKYNKDNSDLDSVLQQQIRDKQQSKQEEIERDRQQAKIFQHNDQKFNDEKSMLSYSIKKANYQHQQDLLKQIQINKEIKTSSEYSDVNSVAISMRQPDSHKYVFKPYDP